MQRQFSTITPSHIWHSIYFWVKSIHNCGNEYKPDVVCIGGIIVIQKCMLGTGNHLSFARSCTRLAERETCKWSIPLKEQFKWKCLQERTYWLSYKKYWWVFKISLVVIDRQLFLDYTVCFIQILKHTLNESSYCISYSTS